MKYSMIPVGLQKKKKINEILSDGQLVCENLLICPIFVMFCVL